MGFIKEFNKSVRNMRNFARTISAALIFAVLVLSPVALAHEGSTQGSQIAEDTTSSNNSDTASTTPKKEPEVDLQKIKERVEKHKAELKIKLTAVQEARLKARCIGAQGIVKLGEDRLKANVPKRVKAYNELQDHLSKLIEKLKTKGIDTTTLSQQKTVLDGKIASFNTTQSDYQQALSDVRAMDCKTDPAGFKAALETARTKRDAVIQAALDIKNYVQNSIKPTLKTIRQQLEGNNSSSNTTSGN